MAPPCAVIVCPRDMYLQCVALSEFFVPHDFTPMFCHCQSSAKVHLVELYAACCSNECCKKEDFYRVNSSGACVCSFTVDLTNHRQQRKGNTILSCLRTCDKLTTGRKYMENYIIWNAINKETTFQTKSVKL